MPARKGSAEWQGGLKDGRGTVEVGDGVFSGSYSFGSRFEEGGGTNPEELIGAAHAACFSMAFAAGLEKAGHKAERVATTANVHLEKGEGGFAIGRIVLDTEGTVPGIDEGTFQSEAVKAGENCPVSKALAGTQIDLKATLV